MEKVQLSLTVTEVNEILAALGQQPYVSVSVLIGNIHTQANAQLQPMQNASANIQSDVEEIETAALQNAGS